MKNDTAISQAGSVCDFVVASVAAGFTIVESVLAEADLHLGLAQAAVALALAAVFRHLALHAAILSRRRSGHGRTVAQRAQSAKVPLVTGRHAVAEFLSIGRNYTIALKAMFPLET